MQENPTSHAYLRDLGLKKIKKFKFVMKKSSKIKNSSMYQAIHRKLMLVDELPTGVLSRYKRDITAKSFTVGKRKHPKFVMKKPTPYFWLEELVVPTFEIAANPTIKFNETKQRRFYIIQR